MNTRRILLHPACWALLVVFALSVVYRWLVYPWRAYPPESPQRVQALWEQVERAAALDPDALAPPELPSAGEPAQPSVDQLVSWSQSPAGAPGELCAVSEQSVLPYLKLGRLALSRANPVATDPSLTAALRLGRVLRRRGTLIGFLVGLALASDAAAWAHAHDVPLRGDLATLAPTHHELLAALAREHVCNERSIRGTPHDGFASILIDEDRELQMLHWHLGTMFDRAIAQQSDPERMASAYRIDSTQQLPKSRFCRTVAMRIEPQLRQAWIRIRDYEQAVAAARSTSPNSLGPARDPLRP